MSNTTKETKAQQSVQKWLHLIDRAEYSSSWSEAATYFQNNITQ